MSGVVVTLKLPPSGACSIVRTRAASGDAVVVAAGHPAREVGADEVGERPIEQLDARLPESQRESVVHLDDSQRSIGDGDEIDERIEGVLEDAPLPEHFLEQLHVLDADRELPSEIGRELEVLLRRKRRPRSALDDERAQRAPPAAQGRDQHEIRGIVDQLRPFEPQPARGRRVGIAGGDPRARGCVAVGMGRRDQDQLPGAPFVQPDRDPSRSGVRRVLGEHFADRLAQTMGRRDAAPEGARQGKKRRRGDTGRGRHVRGGGNSSTRPGPVADSRHLRVRY